MPHFSGKIDEQTAPSLRLDRYVSEVLRLLSRSQIKARNLKAKINGKDVKLSRPVKKGDSLDINWDDSAAADIIPQDIPLDVVYEDGNCIVINKAQGMVVHPGAGNRQGTLVNALCFRRLKTCGDESDKNAGYFAGNVYSEASGVRPGIVHRLDKDTSGIMIAAYNCGAHAFLAEQFKTRKARKNYIAVIQGVPKETKGRIETFIARDSNNRKRFTVSSCGKNAVTLYKVIKNFKDYSLVLLSPRTGRTHQLRVHMKYLGHPILGDPVYGYTCSPDISLMLHSKSLAVTLPGKTERAVFSSSLPERFTVFLER